MNLYLVQRKEAITDRFFEGYVLLVVAAETESQAVTLIPERLQRINPIAITEEWATPEDLQATKIGVADEGTIASVIHISYCQQ